MARVECLTSHEVELIGLVAMGLTNRQIAYEEGVELGTTRNTLTRIYSKLNIDDGDAQISRANLTRVALESRIVIIPTQRSLDYKIGIKWVTVYASYPLDTSRFTEISISDTLLTHWYLVYMGLTNSEIAGQMCYSEGAVKAHSAALYQILRESELLGDENKRVGAVRLMFQLGLFTPKEQEECPWHREKQGSKNY